MLPIFGLACMVIADGPIRSGVIKTVTACFAILCQLRSVRSSLPRSVLQTLVSTVVQRLDSGSSMLAGIPFFLVKRMQPVSDEFCRSAGVFRVEERTHHIPLTQLHWLNVPDRIEFKLDVLVYRCL